MLKEGFAIAIQNLTFLWGTWVQAESLPKTNPGKCSFKVQFLHTPNTGQAARQEDRLYIANHGQIQGN